MRILKLTAAVEKDLLRARHERDRKAETIAANIIADVRKRGDSALFEYTKKFDRVDLRPANVWISQREIAAARKRVSAAFLRALQHAAHNIRRVAKKQLPRPWTLDVESGVKISQRVSPIDSIGCYIPGGRFALVSTMLMTVLPAQVAGVENITVVCPHPNDALLAAADFLGVRKIARIGGTQAVAALAYGTKSIPRVDKIFGPGNRFVTAAKQLVSSDCAIDLPAGPTEAIVLAAKGDPKWIAGDLLAQAEHAPDAGSFLVTTNLKLARAVQKQVQAQLAILPPNNPAQQSMRNTGAILLAATLEAACVFSNRFAAEHL
ncbi:MAG: histidinol dehydrogenase, partial [Candidatus Acidiferrum sp.]